MKRAPDQGCCLSRKNRQNLLAFRQPAGKLQRHPCLQSLEHRFFRGSRGETVADDLKVLDQRLQLCGKTVLRFPVTLDGDAWYFGLSTIALIVLAVLAAYGCVVAVASHRRVFGQASTSVSTFSITTASCAAVCRK